MCSHPVFSPGVSLAECPVFGGPAKLSLMVNPQIKRVCAPRTERVCIVLGEDGILGREDLFGNE